MPQNFTSMLSQFLHNFFSPYLTSRIVEKVSRIVEAQQLLLLRRKKRSIETLSLKKEGHLCELLRLFYFFARLSFVYIYLRLISSLPYQLSYMR